MTNIKNEIYRNLVSTGRELVKDKGVEFLTARKLSEASSVSVGTIYNQFLNMDNYIIVQNMLTLDDLFSHLSETIRVVSPYENINLYMEKFLEFVDKNTNLWSLFYQFHLRKHDEKLPEEYSRKIVRLMRLLFVDFEDLYGNIDIKRQKILKKVLWLVVFSMSPFLTNDMFESFRDIKRKTACKLMLNTYLAGIATIKDEDFKG